MSMSNINYVSLAEMWPFMEEEINSGKTVRFAPRGTSMLPMLRQGIDTVVLKKAPEKLNKYDLPLYMRENGQFVLHRVIGKDKNGYIMRGDNQCVRERGIGDANILANVSGFYRGDTFVLCDNNEYKKYCIKVVKKQNIKYVIVKIKQVIKKILRIK